MPPWRRLRCILFSTAASAFKNPNSAKTSKIMQQKPSDKIILMKSNDLQPRAYYAESMPRRPLHPQAATKSSAPLANSASNADQRSLSCANSLQRPLPCMKFTKTSSHRAIGLPGARNPPTGCQSSIHVVHLPSVRRATWLAHRHFRLLCSVAQSAILP